jgi:hypothetical protein
MYPLSGLHKLFGTLVNIHIRDNISIHRHCRCLEHFALTPVLVFILVQYLNILAK